jgi:hypothetical protein
MNLFIKFAEMDSVTRFFYLQVSFTSFVPLVSILELFFKIIDHSAFEVCFKKLNKASNYDISEQQMLDCATGIEKEYL